MGYNREDFVRIKSEFSEKYLKARKDADVRRWEIYEKMPEVQLIDVELSKTGTSIMAAICSGEDIESKVKEIKSRNDELLKERARVLRENGYPEDYSDIHYECEKCGDTGYVNTKMCDCMRKALIMAGYESSGLAGLIRTQNFNNFSLEYYKDNASNYDIVKKSVCLLKNFAENFSKDTYNNFILVGGTGLGKTHLSTATAKCVIDRGYDVMYVTSLGMLNDFESKRFGNASGAEISNRISRYYDAELLIIDDFGTELSNQFTVSCIYDVMNMRINNRRCTIINTNLNHRDIEAKYGERILSRLLGEYQPIVISGQDIRRQKTFM